MKIVLCLILPLTALSTLLIILPSCSRKPAGSGLVDGRLRPCPERPNCVCSESERSSPSWIAPLAFPASAETAWEVLRESVRELGGTIQSESRGYLWVTFTSRVFRFVDDLELRMVADEKLVQVRSGARTGYSDLGVNRRRVESLRARLSRGVDGREGR